VTAKGSGPKIEAHDFTGVEAAPGMDFPTAWAIQNEVGSTLDHHARCSSVPGWHPLSGPAFLCDCGAVQREHERRATRPTPGGSDADE
jgi:hypothetical protein